jgi:photosystem II core protein PsbZ
MITALTALLVLISLGLVVTVPVALATPGVGKFKSKFDTLFKLG